MARTRTYKTLTATLPIQIVVLRATLMMSVVLTILCLGLASQFDLARGETKSAGGAASAPAAAADAPAAEAAAPQDSQPSGDCQVSEQFPSEIRRWCDQITANAATYGLAPNLVAAVIWFESGGNPTAYSRSGATGLMQVMPRDGLAANFQCANGPCFASRPSRAELEDPDFNIEYGTRMLANLFDRTQSWREALHAYGPMDVGYSYADRVLALYASYDN